MTKLTIIGCGDQFTPSTLFRFGAYKKDFNDCNYELNFIYKKEVEKSIFWSTLKQSDIIINQKCLFSRKVSKKILGIGKPVFFDFDDAIWTRPTNPYSWITQQRVNLRFHFWLRNAKGVMVANKYLEAYATQYTNNVVVIPMSLDLDKWKPLLRKKDSRKFIIGWVGAPHNLHVLESLNPVFEIIKEKFPHVSFHVFSGKKPALNIPFEYFPFFLGKEKNFVSNLDVGLLLLKNNPYDMGKSPIKSLQYLSCQVPVVGTWFGASNEILTKENSIMVESEMGLVETIGTLDSNPDLKKRLGESGREKISNNFNKDYTFKYLIEFINIRKSFNA